MMGFKENRLIIKHKQLQGWDNNTALNKMADWGCLESRKYSRHPQIIL